ncbi:MAG TPA: hypothetical protein ENN39_05585 [Desulfonatronum sp.]|nr:hypothetical protein [Desulfonatronum sp.]
MRDAESERIGLEAWKAAFVRLQDAYVSACGLIKQGGRPQATGRLEDDLRELADHAMNVLHLFREQKELERLRYCENLAWFSSGIKCSIQIQAELIKDACLRHDQAREI